MRTVLGGGILRLPWTERNASEVLNFDGPQRYKHTRGMQRCRAAMSLNDWIALPCAGAPEPSRRQAGCLHTMQQLGTTLVYAHRYGPHRQFSWCNSGEAQCAFLLPWPFPWLQNERRTVKEEEPGMDLPCSWSFAQRELHWFQFPVLVPALWVEKCAPKHSGEHSLCCR